MNTIREFYEELGNLLMKYPEFNDLNFDACGAPGSLMLWRESPDGPVTGISYEDDSFIDEHENNAKEWLKELQAEALSEQHMTYLIQMCMRGESNEDIIDFIKNNAITNDEQSHTPCVAPFPPYDIPFKILAEKKIELTKDSIASIVNIALDGGVTALWVSDMKVKGEMLGEFGGEHIAFGGTLLLRADDETEYRELTSTKLLTGVKLWYENGGDWYNAVQNNGTLDLLQIDASVSDAILQYALFGDVVYD